MNKHIRKLLGLLQHGELVQQAPPTHQRLPLKTPEEWHLYWKAQGQPWRTEPEIDAERQKYLTERRAIVPNIEKGIYPFKDIKLSRADVEWLLATHENGRGPVDWNDRNQREREGLDLRGAILCDADLNRLPLAKLHASITIQERQVTTRLQRHMAAIHLERANLFQAHLESSSLRNARLEGANLEFSHLERADCAGAHFEGAYLGNAHLGGTYLRYVYFDHKTYLDDVSFINESQEFASLIDVTWGEVNLTTIQWQHLEMLGSEKKARQRRTEENKPKDKTTRLYEYEVAMRANRQLAIVLQNQGLNEDAARFAYRAQVLQKSVLWYQMTQQGVAFRQRMQALGGWLFSWFLFLLAGYGYRLRRTLGWYIGAHIPQFRERKNRIDKR